MKQRPSKHPEMRLSSSSSTSPSSSHSTTSREDEDIVTEFLERQKSKQQTTKTQQQQSSSPTERSFGRSETNSTTSSMSTCRKPSIPVNNNGRQQLRTRNLITTIQQQQQQPPPSTSTKTVNQSVVSRDNVPYLLFERLVRQMSSDRERFETEITQMKTKLRAKELSSDEALKTLNAQLRDVSLELTVCKESNTRMKSDLDDRQRKVQTLKQQLSEQCSSNSSLLSEKELLEGLLGNSRGEVKLLERHVTGLTEQVNRLKEAILQQEESENPRRLQKTNQETEGIQGSFRDLQARMESTETQVQQLLTINADLNQQIAQANAALTAMSERVSHRTKELRRLEQRISLKPTDAPEGDFIAIAFSDVENSTPQWEESPSTMKLALELHFKILREKLRDFHGYEVKTVGDSMMAAFQNSIQALRWAVLVQETLLVAEWPQQTLQSKFGSEIRTENGLITFRGIRVRIGINEGHVSTSRDQVTGRNDYFGSTVNKAAKITNLAHGGQILVSSAVMQTVKNSGIGFVETSLGEYKLKGIEELESIWQILPISLKERTFPPLRTSTASTRDQTEPELLRVKEIETNPPSPQESRSITPANNGQFEVPQEFSDLFQFIKEIIPKLSAFEKSRAIVALDDLVHVRMNFLETLETVAQLREEKERMQKDLAEARSEINRNKVRALEKRQEQQQLQNAQKSENQQQMMITSDSMELKKRMKELERELAGLTMALNESRSNATRESMENKTAIDVFKTKIQNLLKGVSELPKEPSQAETMIRIQTNSLILKEHNQELEEMLQKERNEKEKLQRHIEHLHTILPESQAVSLTLEADENNNKQENQSISPSQTTESESNPCIAIFKSKVQTLENELEREKQERKSKMEMLESFILTLHENIQSLEISLASTRVERDELRQRVGIQHSMNSSSSSLTNGIEPYNLARENILLTKKLQEAQDTIMSQASQLAKLNDKLNGKSTEYEDKESN